MTNQIIKSKSLFSFSSHFNNGLYDARYITLKLVYGWPKDSAGVRIKRMDGQSGIGLAKPCISTRGPKPYPIYDQVALKIFDFDLALLFMWLKGDGEGECGGRRGGGGRGKGGGGYEIRLPFHQEAQISFALRKHCVLDWICDHQWLWKELVLKLSPMRMSNVLGHAPREEDGDYLVPHEDVHGLAPREEVLAWMTTTGENSGVRLLSSVYTAAQTECWKQFGGNHRIFYCKWLIVIC